jgi:hypothetical protein
MLFFGHQILAKIFFWLSVNHLVFREIITLHSICKLIGI